jgi:hypothetical protein
MNILTLILIFFSSNAFPMAEGTGLKFMGAADFVGNIGAKNQTDFPRRFDLREAEFGFYGPIDHRFDGNLFFAAHNESGSYNTEVHEAYLSTFKLIPHTRARLGKFFLGVGRLNQIHRHDWPFISTPKAHKLYFDEEAASDTGGQFQILFPDFPVYTELTLGLTNGWTFGHTHNQGVKPIQPTHYGRIQNFFPIGEYGGLQTGLNYLGRNARNDGQTKLFGVDLTGKWRKDSKLNWLTQAELWGRNLKPVGGTLERTFGGYFYLQKHFLNEFYGGLRLDGYSIDTSAQMNLDYSIIPVLNYKHSEFAQFKASYQVDFEKKEHKDSQVNRVVQVQATFILGDHPSHDF